MKPLTVEVLVAHAEWLRQLAAYLLRDGPDAEDVVQETWEAALRSPPDPGRPIRPWLAQVLRNAIRSSGRSLSRRTARERNAAFEASNTSAEDLLPRMRLHAQIARLITELEEPYRSTLLLRFYQDLDAASIARAGDLPPGTVRWRISEGIKRLRERLDQEENDGPAWRAVLAPLAAPARPPAEAALTKPRAPERSLLTAAAGVAILAGLVLVAARPPGNHPPPPPTFIARSPTATTNGPERKVTTTMNDGKIKRLAAFLAVALPALHAAASPPVRDGRRVNLDFKNAKIQNVLRLLSDVASVNIWTANDVKDEVTIKVKDMPWEQVVDQVCREQGLHCQRTDNVILVSHAELASPHPYYGRRIEPDFRRNGKEVDIRVAMATLAEVGQVKIDVADDVHSTVNMKGLAMPWDQVLDVIVWARGLRAERDGDVIRIVSSR
jgi:RNA polymerase sigma factor (sigma-70 family)